MPAPIAANPAPIVAPNFAKPIEAACNNTADNIRLNFLVYNLFYFVTIIASI